MKRLLFSDSERGQALVELMAIIIIGTFLGVGIYEAGAFFHNISVINTAMESAAEVAAHGAPLEEVQRIINDESVNLLGGAFLEQHVLRAGGNASNLFIETWNPRTNEPLVTEYTPHQDEFSPEIRNISPYMFWTEGYEVRVGIFYAIGIHLPYIRSFTLDLPIVGTRVIQANNDVDRDGMMDSQEVEYLGWWTDQRGDTWTHPTHRDDYDTMDTADYQGRNIDGDSITLGKCPLKITRLCDGGVTGCEEDMIEVYNPGFTVATFSELVEDNDGSPETHWSGSITLEPGEYGMLLEDTSDSEYGSTGVMKDDFADTIYWTSGGDVGYQINDDDGTVCDAFGYSTNLTLYSDLGSDFYEKDIFEEATTRSFERKQITGTDIPQDINDNDDDFETNTGFTPKEGYVVEKPYDYNNDGVEDKYDKDDGAGNNENLLNGNHLVGPLDWPDTSPPF